MNRFFTFFLLASCMAQAEAAEYKFRLKNQLGHHRTEVVEVNVPKDVNASQCVLLADDGSPVAFELLGDTAIRFQASINKASTQGYTLSEGSGQRPTKLTYAAVMQSSSRSDIAWENDRCAYRMYSSVLLSSEPNTGNGVDLWVKKKPTPVITQMYSLSNYHNESEYGVDAFSVNGKRLGVGGVSHVVNGKLVIHNPHNKCEVLENGALHSAFKLTYNNLDVNGVKYTKTLLVETRAGSLLNKATVCYTPVAGGSAAPFKLAVALYQHTDMSSVKPEGVAYTDVPGVIGWAERQSEGSVTSTGARFYQGACMLDADSKTEVIDHHLCLTTDYMPGTYLTYYFGGGWSVFPEGDFACDEDWFDALDNFSDEIHHPVAETSWNGDLPLKDDVRGILDMANLHWQTTHPTHGDHFWNRAVYHTGNMAAYEVTHDQGYLDYSLAWAEHNKYWGQTGTDKSRWKYTYGESADYVLFGDNQICFQVYADLYKLLGGEEKIARAREVIEYQMSTKAKDYWWWVDGFYMVMPVMTKLYNITGNELYLEKLHEYWHWGTDLMWDDEESLYYRDKDYVYPAHKTNSGGKDFWARGDGWIMAALPRVLSELPADDKYRDEYIATYRRLAEALRNCQRTDVNGNGYWCRSLLEEAYAPGYETSGTALITFGMLWGVNNGILDETVYGSTIERAWKYLTEVALQDDGTVGYVQPIGSNAAPGTYIRADQTADFGVGAYLLACSEMMRYAAGTQTAAPLRVASVTLADANTIKVKLNQLPDEESMLDGSHYLVDGEPVGIQEITHDGAGTITIITDEPLDYGRYTLTVSGLLSVDGVAMSSDYNGLLVCTVPFYKNTTIKSVTAIGAQSGNPATNVIDGKLSTRWSQEGKQQWIQFNLGSVKVIYAVDLAWYLGDTRVNYFDVKVSTDAKNWTSVLSSQQSSGTTNEMERYTFPEKVEAKYVRIYCNGASTSTWNSMTEGRVCVDEEATGVVLPGMMASSASKAYDLNGRRAKDGLHGIRVVDGRKYVNK
ncbi:MAG: glycoside hydrolase family 88 protein [Bacteroidales bacterium]|nr:glycoside hydrolase family 88 protein [Bacteroidales bacterium]